MSGRKRRDRPLTMDEMLRQAQASMPCGEPRPAPDAAQSSSMALLSRPSTSHPSPSTLVDASAASTASAPPSQLASVDTQPGVTSIGPSSNRGRGPARGIRTWNSGHPIDVQFDETYHPVGPHARQLICQLGHMVRDPYAFPLTTLDWEAFPLDRIWQQVKDNLRACPELFRPVCMSKCGKMWKDHKNKIKKQHWKPHQDAPDILERVPRGVLPDQWTQLVRYWASEEERAQYHSRLEELLEEEHSLPSRRDEVFHSVVGRDGHGYMLTYGMSIPQSHIAQAESFGASSSQGIRLRTDGEVEELLQSMKARIREEVTNEVMAEMRAEMRADMAKLEARLLQSRGLLASDPPPTTQAPDAGSGHSGRHDFGGEGSHDPAGSTDSDQV